MFNFPGKIWHYIVLLVSGMVFSFAPGVIRRQILSSFFDMSDNVSHDFVN